MDKNIDRIILQNIERKAMIAADWVNNPLLDEKKILSQRKVVRVKLGYIDFERL
jgi:hypothetical protein